MLFALRNLFLAFCAAAVLAQTGVRAETFYVQDGDKLTKVDAEPVGVYPAEWQIWLYYAGPNPNGSEKIVGAKSSGTAYASVMKQLHEGQQTELGWPKTFGGPYGPHTFFNYFGPVAIMRAKKPERGPGGFLKSIDFGLGAITGSLPFGVGGMGSPAEARTDEEIIGGAHETLRGAFKVWTRWNEMKPLFAAAGAIQGTRTGNGLNPFAGAGSGLNEYTKVLSDATAETGESQQDHRLKLFSSVEKS